MTRKHFQALADIVAALATDGGHGPHTSITADCLARKLADVCAADNGRFDRDRFYSACGLDHLRAN